MDVHCRVDSSTFLSNESQILADADDSSVCSVDGLQLSEGPLSESPRRIADIS